MARAGFSPIFWVAVVSVIAVPLSIDKFLGAIPRSAEGASVPSPRAVEKADWRIDADSQIGFSCDLPQAPTRIDRYSYEGDSGDFHVKFGRVFTPGKPATSGRSQLKSAVGKLREMPEITHIRASIDSTDKWKGEPTVQLTCSFRQEGEDYGLFYLVREGKQDQTYFQLWFPKSNQKEAVKLLAIVRSSARFGE